ncbi:hypothetical protein HDU99_002781, partial [Rhizoclosmatium hyalinum]
ADGRAVLTDFGLSTLHTIYSASHQTRHGHYLYAPPEAFSKGYKLDSNYDVYSFGMTAYEILTRHKPFLGEDLADDDQIVISWIKAGDRPSRDGTKGYEPKPDFIPNELWVLIEACWAQDPLERPDFNSVYATLEAVNAALKASKDGELFLPNFIQTTAIADAFVGLIDETAEGTPNLPQSTSRQTSYDVTPVNSSVPEVLEHFDASKNAIEAIEMAANNGLVDAQNFLGRLYATGEYVDKDLVLAAKWYLKSAEQSNPIGQFNTHICYLQGEGVEEDLETAMVWLKKAADQGYGPALYHLSRRYYTADGVEKSFTEAFKLATLAAEQGHVEAQNLLGFFYDRGEGIDIDKKKAAQWFLKAAEKNHAGALCMLGDKFENGDGVPLDLVASAEWFRKAATLGNKHAQYKLGLAYVNGKGVERDLEEAKKWMQKASDQGIKEASTYLFLSSLKVEV